MGSPLRRRVTRAVVYLSYARTVTGICRPGPPYQRGITAWCTRNSLSVVRWPRCTGVILSGRSKDTGQQIECLTRCT